MARANWTKQGVNAADYTRQAINPTPWIPRDQPAVTGALLLSDETSFLELSDGNYLGIIT